MAKKKPDPQELAEIDEIYTRLTGLPVDQPRRSKKGLWVLLFLLAAAIVAAAVYLGNPI